MVKIKADNYYLDKERNLIYVAESLDRYSIYEGYNMWQIHCLSSGRETQMDKESLEYILVQDLGPTIAPAMRLLYSSIKTI